MAEVLGVVGSIIGILQLTGTVVNYLSDVQDASKDCSKILIEISSVNGFLFSLKDLVVRAELGETWLDTARSLGVPNGPLAQFKLALERLATHLKPVVGLKKAGKALVWPFKKGEVMDILSTIERQKTLFILALQNDHM
jgi:hypothetical protein